MSKSSTTLFATQALLAKGWRNNVRITIGNNGIIKSIEEDAEPKSKDSNVGIIVPGVPNLHSHAFQRAMAGLTEHKDIEHEHDNFWTWRDKMYEFANKLSPEQIKAIYKQTYKEMLEAGYTSVAEFHYIHHDKDGKPYDPPTLISDIAIEAAKEVGIHITLLPVFYAHSNFGGKDPHEGQRRFINTPEAFLDMLGSLQKKYHDDSDVTIGMAFHSLRAVTKKEMETILNSEQVKGKDFPIHIHIAEQEKEVEDCLQWSGKRPVEWLLDNFPIDKRWTLVHATHLTEMEVIRLAKSGAVVGFCPSTEANLGDGIAYAKQYLAKGGKWGVGSDSNTTIDMVEELRLFEYAQRLKEQKRNVLSGQHSTGNTLFSGAMEGGQQATGIPQGGLMPGMRADILVLNTKHPTLVAKQENEVLGSMIFGVKGRNPVISGVIVGGKWCVRNGCHINGFGIEEQYSKVVYELLEREQPKHELDSLELIDKYQDLIQQLLSLITKVRSGTAILMIQDRSESWVERSGSLVMKRNSSISDFTKTDEEKEKSSLRHSISVLPPSKKSLDPEDFKREIGSNSLVIRGRW